MGDDRKVASWARQLDPGSGSMIDLIDYYKTPWPAIFSDNTGLVALYPLIIETMSIGEIF